MRDFAQRLIACEARGNKSSGTRPPAAFPVFEKLRPQLATLMGTIGVYSLFLRALTLSRQELDSLRTVQVKADGSLERADEPEVQSDPEDLAEGSVVLLAQVLGLLVAFIGENLTLRLVRDAWPKLSLNDFDFGRSDEK